MKRSGIVFGGVVGFSSVLVMLLVSTQAACTLASPTHITMAASPDDGDGGGKASSTASGTVAGGGATATCATDDFIKPDVARLTACGGGKGHCFAKAKTPMASQFVPCDNAADVCVPDEILLAEGKPLKACKAIIGDGGGCINMKLIPEMEKRGGSALQKDSCEAHQVCAPCIDPTNGGARTGLCEPIGVHEKECAAAAAGGDGGAGGGTPAQACCTTRGKSNGMCILSSGIPEKQREQTIQDTCADNNSCVPTAFVNGAPVKCDSGLLGPGLCLDTCFNKMMSLAGGIGFLSKEGCGETEVCIPCRFAKDQGAPGCD